MVCSAGGAFTVLLRQRVFLMGEEGYLPDSNCLCTFLITNGASTLHECLYSYGKVLDTGYADVSAIIQCYMS